MNKNSYFNAHSSHLGANVGHVDATECLYSDVVSVGLVGDAWVRERLWGYPCHPLSLVQVQAVFS